MSGEGFQRTLQTAADAAATAAMLRRVAKDVRGYLDRQRLEALAERYTDYAQALRETVLEEPEEPVSEQPGLGFP